MVPFLRTVLEHHTIVVMFPKASLKHVNIQVFTFLALSAGVSVHTDWSPTSMARARNLRGPRPIKLQIFYDIYISIPPSLNASPSQGYPKH